MDFNVGCRSAKVNDAAQGARIPVRFLYPTRVPERMERFGPYELSVALNAPVEGGRNSLVVISHGGSGSSLTYRDLAACLVRAGFVVALPEHPGNCRHDNSLEGTAENLENRPRHLRLVIDAAFANDAIGARLLRDRVALIGHSMRGYTSLALAGGRPTTGPYEKEGPGRPVSVLPDRRVRALVLLAPACGWFWPHGALAGVEAPILLFTAERDELGPHLHTGFIELGVRDPAQVDHRVIPGAGHFAFQSPFPPTMTRPDFPPSQDPEGFDRAAFQPVLHAGILSFLRSVL